MDMIFFFFHFLAQSTCDCEGYITALNQLNQTLSDFKSDMLKMFIGFATVLGMFSAVLVGNAIKRSFKQ